MNYDDIISISARVGLSTRLYMKISAKVGASIRLYMKKFHKSQRDPSPSRRVNPGLEKGYPARRVDPGWLLRSCTHLLQIDCTRVDPLRRVEANPVSCKGGLSPAYVTECKWI